MCMPVGTLGFLFTYVFLKLIMNEKEELETNFTMSLVFPENKHCALLRKHCIFTGKAFLNAILKEINYFHFTCNLSPTREDGE